MKRKNRKKGGTLDHDPQEENKNPREILQRNINNEVPTLTKISEGPIFLPTYMEKIREG